VKIRWRNERGVTLVELMVALGLLSAVVTVMGPLMTSSFRAGRVVQNESQALDELRIAVARIDRELRSADCITAPVAGTPGSTLAFRTLADPAGPYSATYSVDGSGRLVRTVGSSVEYIGKGLVVTSQEFTRTGNPGQRDSIAMTFQVRFEDSNSPRVIATTIAGRNAWASC
jgi:Tfp pilus assembly protein PilW